MSTLVNTILTACKSIIVTPIVTATTTVSQFIYQTLMNLNYFFPPLTFFSGLGISLLGGIVVAKLTPIVLPKFTTLIESISGLLKIKILRLFSPTLSAEAQYAQRIISQEPFVNVEPEQTRTMVVTPYEPEEDDVDLAQDEINTGRLGQLVKFTECDTLKHTNPVSRLVAELRTKFTGSKPPSLDIIMFESRKFLFKAYPNSDAVKMHYLRYVKAAIEIVQHPINEMETLAQYEITWGSN
jgi:hypothetical protein